MKMWTLNVPYCVLFLILGTQVVDSQDICPNSSLSIDKYSFLNNIPLPVINKTSLVFSVRACEHARVIFTGNKTYLTCSYRIVLGSIRQNEETVSRIVRCKSCHEKADPPCWNRQAITPGILDCNEFRTFWIGMGSGNIRFGKGNKLYSDQLGHISLSDEISPNYVGITVVSMNSSIWRFENEFQPYISPDLYCKVNGVTEEPAANNITNTDDVTSNFTDNGTCKCPCKNLTHRWDYLNNLNLTRDELRKELSAYLHELQQSIAINTKETSKSKAKQASAVDKRVSSTTLGWVGAVIVAILPISFICADLLKGFKQF